MASLGQRVTDLERQTQGVRRWRVLYLGDGVTQPSEAEQQRMIAEARAQLGPNDDLIIVHYDEGPIVAPDVVSDGEDWEALE